MRVEIVPCLSDNLSYLVIDDHSRTCVIIDPSESRPFLDAIGNQALRPVAILTTHHHYDHIGGISELPTLPVWVSQRDRDRIPRAEHVYEPGKTLRWSDLAQSSLKKDLENVDVKLSTIRIPGHTEGQTALIFSTDSDPVPHVFVGDTLFSFGCGRCLEGTPEELFQSLQTIKNLPLKSLLYFGHEYTEKNALFWLSHLGTDDPRSSKIKSELIRFGRLELPQKPPTLEHEISLNPFLQIENASDFRRWRLLRNDF